MEALTRSTMSPPKALNSKTTSDRVETRRRKKNTQWHVCPSLQHTHTRTGPTASGCSPQKENTHSRRCLGNALRQKNESEQTRTKRTEEEETETAIMKQCGRNWICYTDCVQRKCDMKWDGRQSECGGRDRWLDPSLLQAAGGSPKL